MLQIIGVRQLSHDIWVHRALGESMVIKNESKALWMVHTQRSMEQ